MFYLTKPCYFVEPDIHIRICIYKSSGATSFYYFMSFRLFFFLFPNQLAILGGITPREIQISKRLRKPSPAEKPSPVAQ